MPKPASDRILDTMIALSRCSVDQRILLAGPEGASRSEAWRRRGFRRVATTATCRLPDGRYHVAAVEWRQRSVRALAATLDWLVHFLADTGVVVIWTDAGVAGAPGRRELDAALTRAGFGVDTATRCGNGFAVSARRLTAADADGGLPTARRCVPLRHAVAA